MPGDDVVDDQAMIFTESDVFVIGGFLATRWGADDDEVVEDIELAIRAALEYANSQ